MFRAFQFPEDLYLEPAYWAKTGEMDEVEKDEVRVYCYYDDDDDDEMGTLDDHNGQ